MLLQTTHALLLSLLTAALMAATCSNSLLNFLMLSEITNFSVLPLLLIVGVATNNPLNIFLMIPTTIFAATETALIGLFLTHTNNKYYVFLHSS